MALRVHLIPTTGFLEVMVDVQEALEAGAMDLLEDALVDTDTGVMAVGEGVLQAAALVLSTEVILVIQQAIPAFNIELLLVIFLQTLVSRQDLFNAREMIQ